MDRAQRRTPPPLPPWLGLLPLVVAAAALAFAGGLNRSWILLAAAVFHVVLLELIAAWTYRKGELGTPMEAIAEAGVHLTRLVELALALALSMLALVVGLGAPFRPWWLIAGILGLLTVAVALGLRRMSVALAAVRSAGLDDRVKGWGVMAYSNPDDPRLWVPKLFGPGMTLNFARPVAWVILIAVLVPPLAAAAVALIFASRAMR